jgi:hypothetical protein
VFSEIQTKKEEAIPKRGDFFHLKVYRRPDQEEESEATMGASMTKYQEPFFDKSATFKF